MHRFSKIKLLHFESTIINIAEMVKYNITEKKEKKAVYGRFMSPEVKDELQEKYDTFLLFVQTDFT